MSISPQACPTCGVTVAEVTVTVDEARDGYALLGVVSPPRAYAQPCGHQVVGEWHIETGLTLRTVERTV